MRRLLACLLPTLLLAAAPAAPAQAQDTWTTPFPGVRRLERQASGPRRIHALEIDLCADGIAARTTLSSERRRTVSSFATSVGAVAAVNGDFFSFDTYRTSGLAASDARPWSDTQDTRGASPLIFGDDRVELHTPNPILTHHAWMREVVSGRQHLVEDGAVSIADNDDFCTTRHPRTAVGLSRDGRKLLLAVVDGRSSASIGMRCTELAELMRGLGAWRAVNLDGGGSSTLWVRGAGVVNRPSDGSERTVGNHLALLRTPGAEPASCNRVLEASAHHAPPLQASTSTDIDGDGLADLCGRGPDGFTCALASPQGLGSLVEGPRLANANGWRDPSNWATLQLGDINGDGRADLCARANAGVRCWPSRGDAFGPAIDGPAWSDDNGWDKAPYYATLRLADFDGDGRDDLCARAAAGFRCHLSQGDAFGPAIPLDALKDDNGWDEPHRYGTLRMGDINGDGRADLCARAAAGIRCWRSRGDAWGNAIDGPAWSDADGWTAARFWSTLRLIDLDGDGRDDLCARAAAGLRCHLSQGDAFGPAINGPAWSDERGWGDYSNHATLLFGDLDADGDLDVCARANAGISCARFNGQGFDNAQRVLDQLTDASGWDRYRYYSTLRLADVNGDGRADLCARAAAGIRCWHARPDGTFEASTAGPAWSDDNGWNTDDTFATLRLASPACRAAELCNGRDDTCDGQIDEGCEPAPDPDAGAPTPDADDDAPLLDADPLPEPDAPEDDDATPADDASFDDDDDPAHRATAYAESCAASPRRAPHLLPLLLLALGLLLRTRR